MQKKIKRIITLSLATALVSSTLTGFSANKSLAVTSSLKDNGKAMTINLFSSYANYQGILKGWGGKILKDKFNATINIIAPNVAGGGDTLFDTRSAAGNLGDIVMTNPDKMQKCIKAGLLYNMASKNLLKAYGSNIAKYNSALAKYQTAWKTGSKVFVVPDKVSSNKATVPSENTEFNNGFFGRWDWYTGVNKPKIKSIDDIVSMCEKIQKKYPKAEDGKKTYATALFKDWDNILSTNGLQYCTLFGWHDNGYLEYNSNATKMRSMLDKDSYYMQAIQLFFKLNQKGLLDPDSATENWDTTQTKFQNGEDAFSFWWWLGKAQFNTRANEAKSKGYEMIPVSGQKIFSYGCNPTGSNYLAAIGSKCSNPVRAMKVLNWLYSAEGMEMYSNGIKGYTYTTKNKKNVMTSTGLNMSNDAVIPAKFGGGTWFGGALLNLNFVCVNQTDKDPNTGETFVNTGWSSYQKQSKNNLDTAWSKAMGGAKNQVDYCIKNNQVAVQPGNNYVSKTMSSDLTSLQNQIGTVTKQYSWKMIYASSQSEFNSLYNQMISQVNGLGISKIYAFNKSDIQALAKALAAAKKAK